MKIDPKILAQYKKGAKEIIFNEDDRDLATIVVPLPETPPFEQVDGYGLPPEEQYFRHQELPQKIYDLQELGMTVDEIWEEINSSVDYYKTEIEWMRVQWERRLYGYWFFNNGVATYIVGWNYFFMNFWKLPEGLPEYRNRDRKWFIFAWFCYQDPSCYGYVDPKHRRAGSTSKAQCVLFCIISILHEARSGTQSKTDSDAAKVFQNHLINPLKNPKFPFFFKPNTSSGDDPIGKLSFRAPATKGLKGLKKRSKRSLLSAMTFESSGEQAYDGDKLFAYHHDEIGKPKNVDITVRWDVVKPCLAQGAGGSIHGFSLHTSTAGEMSKGGTNFKNFCEESDYADKNENGQTGTGLYVMFMPAWEGLDGYVDRYGESVIDTPTEQQTAYLKTLKNKKGDPLCANPYIGAKQFIQNTINSWKKKKNYKKLNEFMRQTPTSFRGCFIADASQSFFDLVKINDRLDKLHDMPNATTTGYFEWDGKPHNGKVKFVVDPDNPKFEVSKLLSDTEANRVKWNQSLDSWEPLNGHKYCSGGDPFAANETKDNKNSLGGGAVFEGQNIFQDPDDKPYEEWESCRFVCTYLWRPADKEEYSDDMIMMCIYYGCPMNPETNVKDLREKFIEKGYRWMLVHHWNIETETQESIAGQATSPKIKQALFKAIQLYVNRHIHKERHKKLIEQIRDTVEIKDMTDYDLFTAAGYAILGFDQYGIEMQEDMKGGDSASQDLTDFIPEYSY